MARKDLTGKVFGLWLVTGYAGVNNHRATLWRCKCSCGNEKVVTSVVLARGESKSCGCMRAVRARALHKKNKKYLGERLDCLLYANYKSKAKGLDREFALSEDDFYSLVHAPCFYCGRVASNSVKDHYSDARNYVNGIDRIDSAVGYVLNNSVSCCEDCNTAKMKRSQDQFFTWAVAVKRHIPNRVEYAI